jgi:hypothetical protein
LSRYKNETAGVVVATGIVMTVRTSYAEWADRVA